MLTKDDIKIIDSQDHKTLAAWWVKLNKWGWPKELPNKPKDRYNLQDPNNRGWSIMSYINDIVGNKATSWEWNKNDMSPEYFEEWYILTYVNSPKTIEERMKRQEELDKKYDRVAVQWEEINPCANHTKTEG